jgi:hypothetical protein
VAGAHAANLKPAAAAQHTEKLRIFRKRVRVVETHNQNRKCAVFSEFKRGGGAPLRTAQHGAYEMQNDAGGEGGRVGVVGGGGQM